MHVASLPANVDECKRGLGPPASDAWCLISQQAIATFAGRPLNSRPASWVGYRVFRGRAAPGFAPDARVEHVASVSCDVTERTRREEEQAPEGGSPPASLLSLVRRAVVVSAPTPRAFGTGFRRVRRGKVMEGFSTWDWLTVLRQPGAVLAIEDLLLVPRELSKDVPVTD